MILNALHVFFQKTKDEIPPRACEPSQSEEKHNVQDVALTNLKNKKGNNVHNKGSPPVRPSGESEGRKPLGCKVLGAQPPRCARDGGARSATREEVRGTLVTRARYPLTRVKLLKQY